MTEDEESDGTSGVHERSLYQLVKTSSHLYDFACNSPWPTNHTGPLPLLGAAGRDRLISGRSLKPGAP